MKKVYIQTFGCQMNTADSAEMMLALAARGCFLCGSQEEADIVLINTCTIREHAEHKSLSLLGRLRRWKNEKPNRIIIYTGCAAQIYIRIMIPIKMYGSIENSFERVFF